MNLNRMKFLGGINLDHLIWPPRDHDRSSCANLYHIIEKPRDSRAGLQQVSSVCLSGQADGT